MFRYFLEVRYLGARYAGFQIQQNAKSIQGELERVLAILFRGAVELTGSSRTDAGVHARQNYFHFDSPALLNPGLVYNINAMLPQDLAVISLKQVNARAHCRFDAIARSYQYRVYTFKDPFEFETGYYFPYSLDFDRLQKAAGYFLGRHDFKTFSKRNTQVKTFLCNVQESEWQRAGNSYIYKVRSTRFLRGMVRGLVGTMLLIGRGKLELDQLSSILASGDPGRADFSVPGKGLTLERVDYPESVFDIRATNAGLSERE